MSSSDNPVLAAALACAERGWRVFPCDARPEKPHAKSPLLKVRHENGVAVPGTGWPAQASINPVVISGWWRFWPDALIGMAPGWANAFVVDLDPKGEPVEAVEARLVEAIGAPLPWCPRTVTQSGGRHLWFRRPSSGEWGNTTPGLKNIDIRCDLGYVILPPSRLRNGNHYAWEAEPYDGQNAPEVPQALLDLIAARRDHSADAPRSMPVDSRPLPPPGNPGEVALRRYGLGALDSIKRDAGSQIPGHRGKAIFAGACAAGRLVEARVLSEREAFAALYDAAELCGLIKDDGPKRVEREIARGIREGRQTVGEIKARLAEIENEAIDRERQWQARGARRAAAGARLAPPADVAPFPDSWPDPWQDNGTGRPAAPVSTECDVDDSLDDEDDDSDDAEDTIEPDNTVDPAVLKACAPLDQCDTDNGIRLLKHFGADLKVRIQEGGRAPVWVTFVGDHWDDVSGAAAATRYAQRVGNRIKLEREFLFATPEQAEAIKAARPLRTRDHETLSDAEKLTLSRGAEAEAALAKRRGDRVKFGVSSKNAARVAAMLAMAAPHVLTDPAAFNADVLKVACATSTLKFVREMDPECPDPDVKRWKARVEVVPGHRRDDLITKVLPVAYDPAALAQRFTAFLERFQPDPQTRRFLQVACGLGLLGLTEQVFIFHYGEGANGKSVFLEVICRVLGALAASLPAEAIAGEDGGGGLKASPEIARLYSVRFVRVAELKEGVPLHEDFVKRITGSESFPARNLFEGYFEFKPIFIAHGSGNGYPKISGTDNGIWRRMRVVKWPVTLQLQEQRNFEEVVGELVAEAPGILAWMVEGARIYLEEGLVPSDSIKAETKAYRDEMDSVGRFFEACVTVTGEHDDQVTGREFYRWYAAWCDASGLSPVKETRFGRDARTRPGVLKEDGRIRIWRGIVLHDLPERPPRSPSDAWGET